MSAKTAKGSKIEAGDLRTDSCSDDGRGFNSVFHHHPPGFGTSSAHFSCLKSPSGSEFPHIGFGKPTGPNARNLPFSGLFLSQSRLLSLFCFRVGEGSNGQNQALAHSGSPSPTPAGQASNRATTSRCAAQSTGNGLR